MEKRVEESAEEVLARLERYVESRRARPPAREPVDRRASPVVVEALGGEPAVAVDTLIPTREEMPPAPRRFTSEIAPAMVAVAICSMVIVLSGWFGTTVAIAVGAALMVVGVVGLVRRVPLARAYTFGLVIAALLIRFS